MPISDTPDYAAGHFNRVYHHIIKPACIKANFSPIRADDVASSNYIIIDILQKIISADMLLCDISGRNPNVLYELGVRHAFNLPTIIIKDNRTVNIFDIQGLRNTSYDENLRVDQVESNIEAISKALRETSEKKPSEINSMIQLLGITEAKLPEETEISQEGKIILEAIQHLAKRVDEIELEKFNPSGKGVDIKLPPLPDIKAYRVNGQLISIGEEVYSQGKPLGVLYKVLEDEIWLRVGRRLHRININSEKYKSIDQLPF